MVIRRGNGMQLGAVDQEDAADHIYLPQLHRPAPLPPPVIRTPPPTPLRLDQPKTAATPETPPDGPVTARRVPARAASGSGPDPTPDAPPAPPRSALNHRRHLMPARQRPRRPISQIRQATVSGIPAQPQMHRLPRHPNRRATTVTGAPSSTS
jgi:hypothetical protein